MDEKYQQYWKRNLAILVSLLIGWFVFSYGLGILLAEPLNSIRFGGFKMGFWFAQQGSQYAFIIIIFIYVYMMNRLDREFDVREE
ncbi:MAG: DUF4212 domain-containing protein [Balneolia bacterium]|nr:DUF4212 domain-containing protein [Balneolia bacterium]